MDASVRKLLCRAMGLGAGMRNKIKSAYLWTAPQRIYGRVRPEIALPGNVGWEQICGTKMEDEYE